MQTLRAPIRPLPRRHHAGKSKSSLRSSSWKPNNPDENHIPRPESLEYLIRPDDRVEERVT